MIFFDLVTFLLLFKKIMIRSGSGSKLELLRLRSGNVIPDPQMYPRIRKCIPGSGNVSPDPEMYPRIRKCIPGSAILG